MSRYKCLMCGYIYDEALGIPEAKIAPGTKFADLPADWVCPLCGSPKSMFDLIDEDPEEPAPKAAKNAAKTVSAVSSDDMTSVPAGYDDALREMSVEEMAALCSNLSKGCEKQCLMEESAMFAKLSDYYMGKAKPVKNASTEDLLRIINENLNENLPSAKEASENVKDRGALRIATWSGKVTAILQSLMDRYGKEGNDLLKNTNVYVCDICGFIYIGDEPPAICPICKVPSFKLVKIPRV